MSKLYVVGLMAVVLLLSTSSLAQQVVEPSSRAAPPDSGVMEPQVQNGIGYLCGGVGIEEAARMKEQTAAYNLKLTFAAKESGYLANVDVTVSDSSGNALLKTFCGAPILLVQLPRSGSYQVKAETGGYTLRRTVAVHVNRTDVASVVMLWPHQLAESVDPAPITSTGDSGTAGTSGASGGDEEFEYRSHQ